MKKAILTCGLFSLMLVLTSFTSTSEIGGETQSKPREPKTLGFEIGGETQSKPREPKTLGIVIGGETQSKPREPKTLGIGNQYTPVSVNPLG